MSGYRQSSFDLNANERGGAPMRPFNRVQWLGVASAGVALSIDLVYLAGRAGLMPNLLDSPAPSTAFLLLAVVLITSRRYPATDPAPELALARRRWLIITVAIVAAVLGAATVIEFSGAH